MTCTSRHPRYSTTTAISSLKCHGVFSSTSPSAALARSAASFPASATTRPHVGHEPSASRLFGLRNRLHVSHQGIAVAHGTRPPPEPAHAPWSEPAHAPWSEPAHAPPGELAHGDGRSPHAPPVRAGTAWRTGHRRALQPGDAPEPGPGARPPG